MTAHREELVGLALRKGWVRVRAWRGEVHFEGVGSFASLRRVARALEPRFGYGPMTLIVIVSWRSRKEERFLWGAKVFSNTPSD